MKQHIKNIITQLGLGEYVDRCRFNWIYHTKKGVINQFKINHPNVALPEPFMIYETFRLDYDRYWNSGMEDAKWIIDSVQPYIDLNGKKILDWGCGPARIIRHIPSYIQDGQYYGTDYNQDYIDWNKNHISGITFHLNQLSPPLPFEAESIDFFYAISIFTHLSASKHDAWIAEFYRILSPQGVGFFTTHGDVTMANLTEGEKQDYKQNKIVERGNVKEGNRMYTAYHPPAFIRKLLEGKFTILEHIPGTHQPWGYAQDIWIIRKV